MKAKAIKAVLRKKINEWADTIEDPFVQDLVLKDTIVTGGAIASMLLRESVNDYDVYFRTRETTRRVALYYIARFHPKQTNGIPVPIFVEEKDDRIAIAVKSAGVASADGTTEAYQYFEGAPAADAEAYVSEVMDNPGDIEERYVEEQEKAERVEDKGYRPVFVSTNAITLSNRVQVIIRFFGEPDKIHENYDFVHCTNYWTSHDDQLVLRPAALEALLTRELRYVGSKYPVASLIRLRKFIQRGWSVNAGQILKMIMQVNALNLKDYEVLREQLTGVDCAYFTQVLDALANKDPTKIDTAYLVEIIDRMF